MNVTNDKSSKETKDSMALAAYINNTFSRNEKAVAIDKIMQACFVSRQVVYNWMYGHSRISELYKHKIEEIFDAKIFCRFETL